jgi:hypothetical protein
MVNSRLKDVRNCRLGHLLLLAAATGWAWTGIGLGQPLPGPAGGPQGQGMAAKAVARRAVAKSNPTEPSPSKQAEAPSKSGSPEAGRRDPFLVPGEAKVGGAAEGMPDMEGGGPVPPGKKGLLISQLRLEGVVRQSDNKPMIAVVANATNRAYFLRENDEVYNGVVTKITPDSVYFTESVRDASGQMSSHEVIKRLGSGPGENR